MADRVEPVLSLGEGGGPNKVVMEETFQYNLVSCIFLFFFIVGHPFVDPRDSPCRGLRTI